MKYNRCLHHVFSVLSTGLLTSVLMVVTFVAHVMIKRGICSMRKPLYIGLVRETGLIDLLVDYSAQGSVRRS